MAVQAGGRWTFTDTTANPNVVYTFRPNPTSDEDTLQKTLAVEATTAPGTLLLMEGTDTPRQVQIGGDYFAQQQQQVLEYFYNLRSQFQCVDDLGRTRWLYCTEMVFTRKRSAVFQWRGTWQGTYYVLSETFPTGDSVIFDANPSGLSGTLSGGTWSDAPALQGSGYTLGVGVNQVTVGANTYYAVYSSAEAAVLVSGGATLYYQPAIGTFSPVVSDLESDTPQYFQT